MEAYLFIVFVLFSFFELQTEVNLLHSQNKTSKIKYKQSIKNEERRLTIQAD
jgi:hypothetical protein